MNGFIWQQLSEIQKSIGALQESQRTAVANQAKAEEKLSEKLSKIDTDLSEIKQIWHTAKVLFTVLVIVGSLILTVVGFAAKEIWDIAKPVLVEKIRASTVPIPAPTAVIAPTSKPKP